MKAPAVPVTDTLRRWDKAAGLALLRILCWFALAEPPTPGSRVRLLPTIWAARIPLLGWIGGGLAIAAAANLALLTGPAFLEGRLRGFANAPAARVADLVTHDPFADRGTTVTSLGRVSYAYSPVADTFVVRALGQNLTLTKVGLVCGDANVAIIDPASDTVAHKTGVPWPCATLFVTLVRKDTGRAILVRIRLDGTPLPREGLVDAAGSLPAGGEAGPWLVFTRPKLPGLLYA